MNMNTVVHLLYIYVTLLPQWHTGCIDYLPIILLLLLYNKINNSGVFG